MPKFTPVNPKLEPFVHDDTKVEVKIDTKQEMQAGVRTSVFSRLWSAFKRAHHKNMAELKEINRKSKEDYKSKIEKINKDTEDNLERLRKKKEENPTDSMSTGQVLGTVAVIAVIVMLIVDSLTPDTLDASKATKLCADKLHEGAVYGSDFNPWMTGHFEDDFRFTVHAAGTRTNQYGTEVKVTMVCLVNKLAYEEAENKADVITSSVLRMGHI